MEFILQPLTLLTFFPLIGVLAILSLGSKRKDTIRWVALVTTLITFGISLWVLALFDVSNPGLQMEVKYPWIQGMGWSLHFYLAIDGLSVLLVLLTAILMPISILSTWTAVESRVKDFMVFFLLLEVNLMGAFLAQDLFLFYVFWELSLVPMYFIIGVWGGPHRVYAAIKLLIYTVAGSLLMLIAILFLGVKTGTLSLPDMLMRLHELYATGVVGPQAQLLLFVAFTVAFAIKAPMWPLHSWLPDAYAEAPAVGSAIMAGALAKLGTYGFLRFNLSLFPDATIHAAPWLALFATFGVVYCAWVAYAQMDIKRLIAYSSVSHLGFVMLGLFALNVQGITGAVLQMFNHGIITCALFLLVGMIYERTGTSEIKAYGGLWKAMPAFGTIMLISMLSSAGLPGLSGFVGEFIILLGAFGSKAIGSPWYASISALGVVMVAVYLPYMFQRVCLGPLGEVAHQHKLSDLSWREVGTLLPLVFLMFWIGLYPKPFLDILAPAVAKLLSALP